jgi:hypothetical protein
MTNINIELQKKHWRSIIVEAMDEINDLSSQFEGLYTDGKDEIIKLLIGDLKMIKAEATVELLRIKVQEGYELFKEKEEDKEDNEDDD